MKFVTNSYIYENNSKKQTKIKIDNFEVIYPFNRYYNETKKEFEGEGVYFFDYDFSVLGDYLYYDDEFLITNEITIHHRFLDIETRENLLGDLTPIKNLINRYLKKNMVVISFEPLEKLGIKKITPFEAIEQIKVLKSNILIKTNNNFIPIDKLVGRYLHSPYNLELKINKSKKYKGFKGVFKFDYKIENSYLYIKDKKIDLKELL